MFKSNPIKTHQQAEESLRESERAMATLISNLPGLAYRCHVDRDWTMEFVSEGCLELTGYTSADFLAKRITFGELLHPDYAEQSWNEVQAAVRENRPFQVNYFLRTKSGEEKWCWEQGRPVTSGNGGDVMLEGIIVDLTDQKRSQQALRESEGLFRSLFENMLNGFAYCKMLFEQERPKDFIYLEVNNAFGALTGLKNVIGKKVSEVIPGIQESDPELLEIYGRVALTGKSERHEIRVGALGMWFSLAVYSPKKEYFVAVFDVISERKQAEHELVKLNRVHALISQINQLIVRARDANTLFAEVCRTAIEHGKFRMAWIGMVDGKEGRVNPVVWDGVEEGYLTSIKKIPIADCPEGRGPVGTALREGKLACHNDIRNDPAMAPWRDEALKRGYGSVISLPIIVEGKPTGAFTLYASEPFFFNEAECRLLEDMTNDISFALEVMAQENQRKRAENALRGSEASLAEAQRIAHIGSWEWDIGTNDEVWSDEMYRLLGLAPGSTRPTLATFLSLVHPDDRENLILAGEKAQEEKHSLEEDYRVIRADGAVRQFQSRAEVVRDAAGNPMRMVGTTQDVTERKQAEETVVKLKKAVDTSGEVIFMTDRAGIFTFVNPEFTRLYGYTAEEVVGKKTPRVLKSGIMSTGAYASFWKTILEKRVARFEMINTTKDGRLVFAESSVNPILDDHGDIAGFLAIQQDITERKQTEEALRHAEERFRKAFNTNPEPVTISTMADGRYTDVNESFLRILGYRREEVIGHTSREINYWQVPEDRDSFIRQLREHGKVNDAEIKFRTKSGENRSGLLSAETIELNGQECLLAVTKDITARKDLEQQFRQAQKMEAIGKLAGGVAHDFNNLLTVINGYAEVMMGQLQLSSPHTNYLNEIRKAGERAAGLTRQLLAFSRQQVLAPQVLDLNQVIANVHTMLKRLIGEDIDLVTTPGQRLGLVKADPGQIDQVLLNLAVNARDAMLRGGKLSIETANAELSENYAREHMTVVPGTYVMLAVTDSGTGMDAETQKRIFEPFFTTKEKGKGTGLGLSTVYGIVKQSEGYIWVYSEVGRGTTFKIYLPRVDAPIESAGPAKSEAEQPGGKETVLVVEDDAPIRQLISETLKSKGYEVHEAANGEEALALAGKHRQPIQLLLTDLVMPGMSGRILAERMLVLHPAAKVLYISGYTDDAVIRHGGLEAGTAFLQKPFTPDSLVKKVRKVLDASQR